MCRKNSRVKTWARFGAVAVAVLAIGAVNVFAQGRDTVRVAIRVAAPDAKTITAQLSSGVSGCDGGGAVAVTHKVKPDPYCFRNCPPDPGWDELIASAPFGVTASSVLNGQRGQNAPAVARYSRGSVSLNLNAHQFRHAEISLFSVNGKRVLRGKASASDGAFGMPGRSLAPGAYLLSVKGVDGNTFTSRVAHRGGKLDVNAAFGGSSPAIPEHAAVSGCGNWTLTITADGYEPTKISVYMVNAANGRLQLPEIQLVPEVEQAAPKTNTRADFTETVGNVSFDMIYIPGGSFTLGCDDAYRQTAGISSCPANTGAVQATVSSYFIAKDEVRDALWNAVMGSGLSTMDWYHAHIFACRLSKMTGRKYRMTTEAEWEYAAKNHRSKLERIGSNEEWAYNTWNGSHSGGTDPIGPGGAIHNQKTRRDAASTGDAVTGRLIRSIEGVGPALRLVISADMDYPPNMRPPCDIHAPEFEEPVNSYRDPRWITGGDERWSLSNFSAWEDGTASWSGGTGQWFTSNNIVLVLVRTSSSGAVTYTKYPYIFLDPTQGSTLPMGRYQKQAVSTPVTKPNITNLKTGRQLAEEATATATVDGESYMMIDMSNIPMSARRQDPRLLDGPSQGWFQNNRGSSHHYRKDVDPDEFRFTVNDMGMNARTYLAVGTWFTVHNTFLRVTGPNGYTADYLYTISGSSFMHNSFMAYERGDFRGFTKTDNGSAFRASCGSLCDDEIPKGQSVTIYAPGGHFGNVGHSTFVPAPCPTGGCN